MKGGEENEGPKERKMGDKGQDIKRQKKGTAPGERLESQR